MITKHLKNLLSKKEMTIRDLAERTKKSHPQYSRILTGKVEPTDDTLMEILIKGFDIPYSQARDMIAQWRMEEALSKASDRSKVINSIIAGDNSIVINGSHGSNINIQR